MCHKVYNGEIFYLPEEDGMRDQFLPCCQHCWNIWPSTEPATLSLAAEHTTNLATEARCVTLNTSICVASLRVVA